MVLEKGLTIFGSSRSGRIDFEKTIKLLNRCPKLINYLENIITNKVSINSIKDIDDAFILDFNSKFGKTILKWDI